MDKKEDKNDRNTDHKRYAGEKKPSMKRRCSMHDYRDRGIYMITMVTEGRQPLLGTLAGDPSVSEGPERPHIVLSPFGEKVKQCWEGIPRYHPLVEVMQLCIMPDHIHGLLFVHDRMEKHLGQVVAGFKTGCNKAARELGVIAAALPQPTKPYTTAGTPAGTTAGTTAGTPAGTAAGTTAGTPAGLPLVGYAAAMPQPLPQRPQRWGHYDRQHGALWEPGYNDRILRKEGQLQRLKNYLADNPRRLLLKRYHPEFFSRLGKIALPGLPPMDAYGNRFLLDNPVKLQVQCSRHLYAHEIEAKKEAMLSQAVKEGAVLVSPCISDGEQKIATAAMAEGLPLIVLLVDGLPPLFKPAPRYIEACLQGRLLIMSPFPYQNEKIGDMRARCLKLNDMAATICA